ncbi:RIP metalloprotease RseP [Undibacterium sp.]|uniref:RIP metalloprotease RseP n=1 Tax=Undibacterium sp. TaxID=1914977 RepID=UPI0025FF1E7E|nr:RIP metalloprotease RseP [Undibacterium sp.]
MMLLQTILAFVVALGSLVTIHELGHYLVARWCGVKILRFSVGMGKVVYSRKLGADQTEWAISILPLGGYVKMLDAREQDVSEISEQDLLREFSRQSVWNRIAIVAAGPVANFLLAILLFTGLYLHGIPEPVAKIRVASETSVAYQAGLRHGDLVTAVNGHAVQTWTGLHWEMLQLGLNKSDATLAVQRVNQNNSAKPESLELGLALSRLSSAELEADFLAKLGFSVARPAAILQGVELGGPASRAGLLSGDQILEIDGRAVLDGLEFMEIINASSDKTLQLLVKRGSSEVALNVTPEAATVRGEKIGRIKVQLMLAPEMLTVANSPLNALIKGSVKTWETSMLTFKMLGKMLAGDVSWKNLTGPITIADYAGQTSRTGLISYLSFIALISISLGVMNLLPIPVLDGGHLLYYSLEVLTGKPVSERFGEIAQRAGVVLLMSLMAVAFFNDIVRLMS